MTTITSTPVTIARWTIGSRMTGIAGEQSDHDQLKVVVMPSDFYTGMNVHGYKETYQTISYDQDGRRDVTTHEWRKFLRLVATGNPSVFPLFFAVTETHDTAPMNEFFFARQAFVSVNVPKAFFGAAQSSVKKNNNGKGIAQAILYLRWLREFLESGTIFVDRTFRDAEQLREIRTGEDYALQYGRALLEQETVDAQRWEKRTVLPAEPDMWEVNRVCEFGIEWARGIS